MSEKERVPNPRQHAAGGWVSVEELTAFLNGSRESARTSAQNVSLTDRERDYWSGAANACKVILEAIQKNSPPHPTPTDLSI